MTKSRDPQVDLLAEKMDHHLDVLRYQLNRELFRDLAGITPTPPTRRQRVRRLLAGARLYLATLWRAVKGEDPYEGDW